MDIITALQHSGNPHEFIEFASKIIDYDSGRTEPPITKWGKTIIDNPSKNPAKELLRTLIFENASAILDNILNPSKGVLHHLYADVVPPHDVATLYLAGITSLSWQELSPNELATFADDALRDAHRHRRSTSSSLKLVIKYLRGDSSCTTALLFALTNRVWKLIYNSSDKTRLHLLYAFTLISHHALAYTGFWPAPNTDSTFIPGIQNDELAHLDGKLPIMASQYEWDNWITHSRGGHPDFDMMRPIDLKDAGLAIKNTITFNFGTAPYKFIFADFDDEGVALITHFGRHKRVAYFLSWPDDYEEAIVELFKYGRYHAGRSLPWMSVPL